MPEYVPDGVFARSREAFARAEEWLAGPAAAGLGLAGLEEELQVRGQEIKRRLLQDHLAAGGGRAAAGPGDGPGRDLPDPGRGGAYPAAV